MRSARTSVGALERQRMAAADQFGQHLGRLSKAASTVAVTIDMDSCADCEGISAPPVLGFSAVQLKDPQRFAFNGAVQTVQILGLPLQRAALGYLHGNCGHCHRSEGPVSSVGMILAHSPDTLATTIARPSRFMAPYARIAAGDSAHSVIVARMRSRSPLRVSRRPHGE